MSMKNPVLPPDVYIPDGEAHVMPDGRLYVYGSWDQHTDLLCSNEYRVVSTRDLSEWTVHDVSFSVSQSPWNKADTAMTTVATIGRWAKFRHLIRTLSNLRRAGLMEQFKRLAQAGRKVDTPLLFAPDAISHNGRFYLFFDLSDGSEGVAVADRPEGPFRDPVRLPAEGIDPAIFIDDDGAAYYYWGQFRASGVRLNDDLLGFDPTKVHHNLVTAEQHHFHEGSSMRKIGDTYYLVFADDSRGKPTSLGYATGPTPLGPFTYRGVIIDSDGCDPCSWNNHGSIERFGDQWYVFYHRASGNTAGFRRLCVEPISIAADGSIAEVQMTSQGAGEPFALGEQIDGWRACTVGGGGYVGDFHGHQALVLPRVGATGTYRHVKNEAPLQQAELTVRGSGTVALRIGSRLSTIDVTPGTVTIELAELPPGTHEIQIALVSGADVTVSSLVFT
ncbi:family 43 glycosylhydrolase [Agromyces sp. Marseille-Q5079]|uniref:family 43 glycosylhydrolase n=1 Tax=Agromyces sp. Marseille-Q5079 TaxID=3439059 RepID=UPI003D9C7FC4